MRAFRPVNHLFSWDAEQLQIENKQKKPLHYIETVYVYVYGFKMRDYEEG